MRTLGNGSQPAQNRAHRNDLVWIKVGRSEYMRSDGVTIRKHPTISAWWQVLLPSGEQPQAWIGDHYSDCVPASGPSLTWAKLAAEHITVDAPIYVPKARR